jgi:endonuclease/exonuclease/phosphatase family metal-dependent hydrolase
VPANIKKNTGKNLLKTFECRVMTYNIHGCVDANGDVNPLKIINIIRELEVDIAALQEVDAENPIVKNRNQAKIISEALDLGYIYFPVEEKRPHHFGLAVLSRFSFSKICCNRLPNLYPKLDLRKRGAIRASIDTPAGKMHIVNTHLSVFKLERRKQLNALLTNSRLPAVLENEPMVLCGDFNAGPSSATYKKLSKHLTDVQSISNKNSASKATFHSKSPAFQYDHIFVSSHFTIRNAEVKRTTDIETASDHLPLVAELAVKKR